MRVNPNSPLPGAVELPARSRAAAPGLGQDQANLSGAEDLSQAFQQTAAARPEEVARATALAEDPAYPPAEVVDSISGLMAGYFSGTYPSPQPV
jgi:hypothetical protein